MAKLGSNRLHLTEVTSTNDYLKDNSYLPHGTVVTTDHQTKGRGRKNHIWKSSKKENVTLSILIKEEIDMKRVTDLTQVIAAAVYKTLKSIGIKSKIKQPNDIFVKNKKISGILIETSYNKQLEYVIVGVGLNVNQTDFNELNDIATSIKLELKEYDINNITDNLLENINYYYQHFLDNNTDYLEVCKRNVYMEL